MDKKNQENAKKVWETILRSRYVLIVTHINPDPDTISSALALANILKQHNIKHKVFNKGKNLPKNVDFLEGYSKIVSELPEFFDLVISVDCGSKSRLGIQFSSEIPHINIDHHISNDYFGTINVVDPHKASTAELIYLVLQANDLTISKAVAQCIYAGMYEDSLAFSTIRCSASTFFIIQKLVERGVNPGEISQLLRRRDSLAKYRILPKVLESLELFNEGQIAMIHLDPIWLKQTGAKASDCELALDMVLNIAVVNIAVFLKVSDNKIRISFRSKNGVDVASIASKFGGGGHIMAAGCVIENKNIDEVKKMILDSVNE